MRFATYGRKSVYSDTSDSVDNQERIIGVYDLLKEDSINRPDIFSNPADNHGAHCLSTMLCQSEELLLLF